MEEEIVGGKITLRQLNEKSIQKLYDLIDSLDAHSDPDLIRSCIESLSKLNSSVKNSDILEKEESEEERAIKTKSSLVEAMLKGE